MLRPTTSVLDPAAFALISSPEFRNASSAEAPEPLPQGGARPRGASLMDDSGRIHAFTCIIMKTRRGRLAPDGTDQRVGTKARFISYA